ncbi:MAG: bifunctional riboflavin kinase/FMN adenylyltransferase [Planctomycetota bacterium]
MSEPEPHAVTIGTFDGVHLGHASLVEAARRLAGQRGRVTAMVFDPHPGATLSAAPARLTTWADRERLLRLHGVDEIMRLEPTEALLALDPEQFVATRIAPIGATDVVEGPDFRFGRKRSGDTGVLAALGGGYGFAVEVLPPVRAGLDDRIGVPVSSTLIRWLLASGRVRDAARLLGRPYDVVGQVVEGDRLGRTIGVPTANVDAQNALPAEGVYAGLAEMPEGSACPAAINVGQRPTVGGRVARLEAHLLRSGGDAAWSPLPGLPEYGWTVRLSFVARLRDQVRFAGIDDLGRQLARDIDRTRSLIDHQVLEEGANA